MRVSGFFEQDLGLNHQTLGMKEKLEQGFPLHELQPEALKCLHELVSIVHHQINQSQPVGNISTDRPVSVEEDKDAKTVKTNLFNLEEDPIANIIWSLEPREFRSVFLTMAVSSRFFLNFC